MTTPAEDPTEVHSLSFDISSPGGLQFIRGLLDILSTNDGINRVALEVESSEPFGLPQDLQGAAGTADSGTVSVEAAAQSTASPATEPEVTQPDESVTSTTETTETPTVVEDESASGDGDETEEGEDGDVEIHVCENCGETFETPNELGGHLRWCEPDEDDSEDTEAAEEAVEEAVEIPDNYSLKPDTWKFKAASTLKGSETPITAGEMADRLSGTAWERKKKHLSGTLAALAEQDVAQRDTRHREGPGTNPYEYWLTDAGASLIAEVEDEAREQGELTFADISEESTEVAEEVEEPATEDVDTTEEADDSSEGAPALSLDPESSYFRIASVLENTSKPIVARNIEERLEESEWEMERSNISRDLGEMYEAGLVDREERSSERGNPFEYTLTDDGHERITSAIEDAEDEGATTFEEVIEGK